MGVCGHSTGLHSWFVPPFKVNLVCESLLIMYRVLHIVFAYDHAEKEGYTGQTARKENIYIKIILALPIGSKDRSCDTKLLT